MTKKKEFEKIVKDLESIFKRCEKQGITIAIVASDGESDLVSAYGTINDVSEIITNADDSVIQKAAKLSAATILLDNIFPKD